VRTHQHHHTDAVRAALARATRRTQPSPQTWHDERDRPRSSPLHTTSARDNTGTFLRSAAAAAALRMYLLHLGVSSSTRVGNVHSAPAATAAGAAETAAAAAVEAAIAASSSSACALGHTHHKRRWSTTEQHGRPPDTSERQQQAAAERMR